MQENTNSSSLPNCTNHIENACNARLVAWEEKNIVFGSGNPDAQLMLVGEGPGRDEDEQGIPFVGKSGQLLNHIVEIVGITRNDIFISNVVKCRPPNNRKPTPAESKICKSLLLLNQIKIICPKVICTLGSVATQELLEQEVRITKIRGKQFKMSQITIIPTYHPAYILRNPKELNKLADDIRLAHSLSL